MPLRSVEAATRDDAIAAAREQFGATARVVGVRRVRSGGVLGFFTTERYVAEVDPEVPARPAPAPSASLEERARAAAESIARFTASQEDKVDELAGLLAPETPAEQVPVYTRSAFQKAAAESARKSAAAPAAKAAAKATRTFTPEPVTPVPEWPTVETDDEGPVVSTPGASSSPSPFTAALARMVSGDREVRQAVQDALQETTDDCGETETPRPSWAAIVRAAEKSAQQGAAHPEEEPVDEQNEQSPDVRPMAFPAWAAEPAVAGAEPPAAEVPPSSPREEVIADILRAALAQGQSDEALADILRTVLAGSSPAAASMASPAELVAEPAEEAWEPAPSAEPLWAEPAPAWTDDTPDAARVDVAADGPIFAEVVLHEPAAPVVEPAPPVAETPVVAEPIAEEPIVDEPVVAQPVATVAAEPVEDVAEPVEDVVAEMPVATLARTASDPAPLPLDATTVMPPLSLLPPLPSAARRGGLPPVPPAASRPPVPAPAAASSRATAPVTAPMASSAPATPLATVVRLPFAPLPEVEETVVPASVPAPAEPVAGVPVVAEPVAVAGPAVAEPAPVAAVPAPSGDVAARLVSFGIPADLLGADFAAAAATQGTYAALTSALAAHLPVAPALPTGPGEVLFMVGPGVETLRAARSLAASLRLDPDRVQWATRGDLAALAPKGSRMTTIEAAIDRRQDAARAGTMTIVAVDAPLRTDAYWMSQMLAIWGPSAVWAVVEATRKPEDLEQWLDGLPRVDALVVQDTDLSADPAAVLARVDTPVALLDGVPATPHRWASLLCERLETLEA